MYKPDKTQPDNPLETFTNGNVDNLEKMSDLLLQKYKGKILEFYIGDQSETINFDDFSVPVNCSIFGKLIDVLDRFIILDCYYFDSISKQLKIENRVYINFFQIRAISEVNGKGSLSDIFLHSKHAIIVRKLILAGKADG
jgi:hypothetical protein